MTKTLRIVYKSLYISIVVIAFILFFIPLRARSLPPGTTSEYYSSFEGVFIFSTKQDGLLLVPNACGGLLFLLMSVLPLLLNKKLATMLVLFISLIFFVELALSTNFYSSESITCIIGIFILTAIIQLIAFIKDRKKKVENIDVI